MALATDGLAAILDTVAGNVLIGFGTAGSALSFLRSGKLKMLAVMDTTKAMSRG